MVQQTSTSPYHVFKVVPVGLLEGAHREGDFVDPLLPAALKA